MGMEEVSHIETTYLPASHENLIRIYGVNGELIGEQLLAVDLGQEVRLPPFEHGRGNVWYDRDTGTLEWTASNESTYYRNIDIDMREWDREQDAHHSVYRREYPHDYSRSERALIREAERYLRDVEWPRRVQAERRARIFCDGEWTGGCDYAEQPDIKDERGGALDEFLDEFKPQTTPERSDEQ